jgi:hypothetical protein
MGSYSEACGHWIDWVLAAGVLIGVFALLYTCFGGPPRYSLDPQLEQLGLLKERCLREEWAIHWAEHWTDKRSVCVQPTLEHPDLNRMDIFYREECCAPLRFGQV